MFGVHYLNNPFFHFLAGWFQAEMAKAELADPVAGFKLEQPDPELHLSREQRHERWASGEYTRPPRRMSKAEKRAMADAKAFGLLPK